MLIVTSDHGMRKGGGHGGSEPEELFVPLLMFESNCPPKTDKKRQPMLVQVRFYGAASIGFSICFLF